MIELAARPAPTDASSPGRRLMAAGMVLAFLAGPLAAVAPRGMAAWALLVLLASLTVLWRHGHWPRTAIAASLAVLAAIAAVSVGWSPSGRAAATALELAYVSAAAVFGAAALGTLPAASTRRIAVAMAAGAVVGMLVFAVELAFDFPIHRSWNGVSPDEVIAGGNVPKRAAALLALLCWPTALALREAWGRWALLVPAAYAGLALVSTSRSAVLGMAAGVAAFVVALWSAAVTRTALVLLVVAAFAGVLPLASLLDSAGLVEADWLFRSARHRVEIWIFAAERALEAPLLGHGIDASRALSSDGAVSRFSEGADTLLPLHPHDAMLQVWLELGAVGAVAACAVAVALLAATRRLDAAAQPYALAVSAAAFAMLSTAYGVWQAWWMAGMAVAALAVVAAARGGVNGPPSD